MKSIVENPFRIIGLPANCSERELHKKISIAKRYFEVDKEVDFDFDFDFLPPISRDTDALNAAASQIEQMADKVLYALFWFLEIKPTDKISLNYLKEGDSDKAIEIWHKIVRQKEDKGGEISTQRDISAYCNLSSLYLSLFFKTKEKDIGLLQRALALKTKLLSREVLSRFSDLVIGKSIAHIYDSLAENIYEEIISCLRDDASGQGMSTRSIISCFELCSPEIQNIVSGKFSAEPLSEVETRIEQTQRKRKERGRNANTYGKALYRETMSIMDELTELLGGDHIKIQMLRDKLAGEILQCSIAYFNYHVEEDNDIDPGRPSLELVEFAEEIGPKGPVMSRIEESKEVMLEYVANEKVRSESSSVQSELNSVMHVLEQLSKASLHLGTLEAYSLWTSVLPKIRVIEATLGESHQTSREITEAVFYAVTGAFAREINRIMDRVQVTGLGDMSRNLKRLVTAAIASNSRLMTDLNLSPDLRARCKEEMSNLSAIRNALNQKKASSGGCYIATMAYGNYDHPSVLVLRDFRDNSLKKVLIGRVFINFYYWLSPYLVNILKGSSVANRLIRFCLERIVEGLRK